MKKSILFTLLFSIIALSCSEQNEPTAKQPVDFREASIFFNEMFSATIEHSVTNINLDVSSSKARIINNEVISDYLTENYFNGLSIDISESLNHQTNARTQLESGHFSEAQIKFISEMESAMMDVESAEDLNDLIVRFRNKATGNDLMTDEQKLEMLAMVEYTHAMHEYLINGGLDEIADRIENFDEGSGAGSRVYAQRQIDYKCNGSCGAKGCSVNWRNVWQDAVVGFVVGGTSGVYVGATGGTVVLGPLGTVTGAVGVGVVGAAGGFVGGALQEIGGQLFFNCLF